MKTAEIRSAYLQFFEERGHRHVPSSPLVPGNDPTLLFTNSGMVQFKDALIGIEDLGYPRATTAQRCVRAGGKHNDLENVGYTARHHTFFEMMGNFSFGDYFKQETIGWAWTFITEVLDLPVDRLYVTVYPQDDESRAIWRDEIGFPEERIIDIEDNFWAMGDTGPCGPCTEIFYDHGPDVPGGPPGSPDEDGDRFVEFWNLVFPQYDRSPDGTLTPLAKPGVDTGMGLERVAAIKQGVHSNYEIDVFQKLMVAAGSMMGLNDAKEILNNASLRVIADHIRSAAFLIVDGVTPSNEGRGYVLRRIIRRGLRHGHKLGSRTPFFHRLVAPLAEEMGEAYPVLVEHQQRVVELLLSEEKKFAETLANGMELLDQTIEQLKGSEIPGEVVFRLYDTFGFPPDLTADVARERGLRADMEGFETAMEAQRKRSQAVDQFDADIGQRVRVSESVEFLGYDALGDEARVIDLYRVDGDDLSPVEALSAGEQGIAVLDRTPFYAESGGQVGDVGRLQSASAVYDVADTRPGGDQHLHHGRVTSGDLRVGETVTATVDAERRRRITLNHSATHLLHAALRTVLGAHVEQKGSLVAPDRLRFDFAHGVAVTGEQLAQIETMVNTEIQRNTVVETALTSFDEAIEKGAIALFGEKYGDEVRVLSMGDGFSVELCGGCHVSRTGDIGVLKLVSESGIAAGVRRIEAVTGPGALRWIDEGEQTLNRTSELVKASRRDLHEKISQLVDQNRELTRELEQLKSKQAASTGTDLAAEARDVDGIKVLGAVVEGSDQKALLSTLDTLKNKLGSAVIVLGQVSDGKVSLIAGVTQDVTDRIKAGDAINMVGEMVGARGGGRPDMARAGGGDRPDALPAALDALPDWVAGRL
jgi:alanyl-tRNA synthetase